MAKLQYKNGVTSVILRVRLFDSTSSTGAGKTGLTFSSSGLIISTIADNESSATTYTAAGSTVETITTLGTFAAPTSTKCRFKEVDATNFPGVYELHVADARWAVSSARSCIVSVQCTGCVPAMAEVQLSAVDPNDAAAGGMSRLDAAITTRLASASYTAPLDAAGTRSAVGLASANLDTQLSTIASYIDMEVATLVTNVSTVLSRLGVPSSDVSTLIAAIKAKTDNLPATPAATGDAMALTVAERASVADKFLGRTLSGSADGGRTVKDALRASRNKVVIDGTTITVYAEDDTTVAWSGTVTRDSALDALSTVDPA